MVTGAGADGRGLITPDQFSLPFAWKKTNHARPGPNMRARGCIRCRFPLLSCCGTPDVHYQGA